MKSRIEELARECNLWAEIVPHDASEQGVAGLFQEAMQSQVIRFANAILELAASKTCCSEAAEAIRKLKV
jgi:hypothetical protein